MDFITVLIIILGAANLGVFFITQRAVAGLEKLVHPKADRRNGISADLSLTSEETAQLGKSSARASFFYTLFLNLTAVFPLLGILGTVISLMKLSGADDIAASFGMALRTTLWGLIFAIVFKLMDSLISAKLDRALDEADYLIHEHDLEKLEKRSEMRNI